VVIGTEDAAVTEAAGKSALDELHEAGGVGTGAIDIDSERDALFATDHVAIGGGNVPDTPRHSFENLLDMKAAFAIRHTGLDQSGLLGYES
jgi:hypothetical protein